jgi:hypothetical protein
MCIISRLILSKKIVTKMAASNSFPTNAEDIKVQLQCALEISYKGLAADNQGDVSTALQCYARVIETLSDIIFFYNKTKTIGAKSKKSLLEAKREKYIQRVNVMWDGMSPENKILYTTKNAAVPSGIKKNTILHSFVDFETSYVNAISIDPSTEVFIPYSTDPMIGTMERILRFAMSIKYGTFYTSELYIPADLWTISIHKIDDVDAKSTAIHSLQKPLARLRSAQQTDPTISNISLLKVSAGEFTTEVDQVRTYIVT